MKKRQRAALALICLLVFATGSLAEAPTDIQGLEAVPEIAGAPAEPTVGEADAAALIEQGETGAGRMLWEELPDGSASSPTLAGDGAALVLPQGLSAVAEEAFAGCEAVSVRIPDGATDIGARTFADCAALLCVRIPESVTAIAGDAFDGCAMDMVIRGVAGSEAWRFAQEKGFAFEREDDGIAVLNLIIDPDEFQSVVDSPDHSYRAEGASIRLLPSEGEETTLPLEYIRGRGNSTWRVDEKKPFRLKLESGAGLLGMGANKNWALMANSMDRSLLRNRLVAYMGRALGLEYTPWMEPVDFYVNGEYMGSYVLSEDVRIANSRVAIGQIDPSVTGGDAITGGYLVALTEFFTEAEENRFTTRRNVRFLMEDPTFDGSDAAAREQYDYITDYLQRTEDAIYGDGCRDGDGVSYAEYMDVDSAARYWWVQEFTANQDAFITPSTYLYKKRDGKLYWGPLWDFDKAMVEASWSANPFNNRPMPWLDHLRESDPVYQRALLEAWGEMDAVVSDITRAGGVLDQYAEALRDSWEKNRQRWLADELGENATIDDQVAALRAFFESRRAAITANLDELLTKVHCTITFMDGDTVLSRESARSGEPLYASMALAKPEKDGCLFLGWLGSDGESVDASSVFVTDTVLQAHFVRDEDATRPEYLFFRPCDMWVDIHNGDEGLPVAFFPDDVQDKRIEWESSDAAVAEAGLDEFGEFRVVAKAVGDAVITGTMRSGLNRSFAVHVYDSNENPVGTLISIAPDRDSLALNVGKRGQMRMMLTPANSRAALTFASSDDTIAAVDEWYGVVTALSPGECTITATDMDTGLQAQYDVVITG